MQDAKSNERLVKITPVPGMFIPGIEATIAEVTRDEADRRIATGAFVEVVDKPTAPAAAKQAEDKE